MNIGDKILINDVEYTLWLIEDGVYHLIDSNNRGVCYEEQYIISILNL